MKGEGSKEGRELHTALLWDLGRQAAQGNTLPFDAEPVYNETERHTYAR